MTDALALSPAAIADAIGRSWASYLERDASPPSPHAYVYASGWRACERRMVYEATIPEQGPRYPADVLARFRRGNDRERDLLADLTRIGRDADPPFAVIGQQERYTLRDHQSRIAIVGKVDARIRVRDVSAPIEVKSWSPFITDRVERFADLFDSPFTQTGAYQLLSYLWGAAEPFGFLLLDRSGIPKLLPVELDQHLDRMETFLSKAERVVDHVVGGTLPDYHDDPAECVRCAWYGGVCNPPLPAPDAVRLLVDPELESGIERWHAGRAQGKAWLDLDEEIKERLRGIEAGVIGSFVIKGRWGKSTRVELPEHLRKQYSVTNPRGRFTLDVQKV
jgi:hypothetical protein